MQFPAQRPDLLCREVDDELVILDRARENIHQLNAAAGIVWKMCDGMHSIENICAALAETYGISLKRAQDDVMQTLTTLAELGLVTDAGQSAQT